MSLGLESGSDKILKIMKKAATVAQGKKACSIAKKYIKNIEACIILGYEGETPDTLKETVKCCKEIGIKPSLFFATPFPGTELYERALKKGCIKDEEEYMMALGTTSTTQFSVNLTDMPDEEALKKIKNTTREITLYYYLKDPWFPIRRSIANLKENGLKTTLVKIVERLTV